MIYLYAFMAFALTILVTVIGAMLRLKYKHDQWMQEAVAKWNKRKGE